MGRGWWVFEEDFFLIREVREKLGESDVIEG